MSRSAREQDREERLAAEADQNGAAVELATIRYKAGLDDYFPVIAAERERLVSEDRLAESRTELVVGAITICKAIGGGWTATASSTKIDNRRARSLRPLLPNGFSHKSQK